MRGNMFAGHSLDWNSPVLATISKAEEEKHVLLIQTAIAEVNAVMEKLLTLHHFTSSSSSSSSTTSSRGVSAPRDTSSSSPTSSFKPNKAFTVEDCNRLTKQMMSAIIFINQTTTVPKMASRMSAALELLGHDNFIARYGEQYPDLTALVVWDCFLTTYFRHAHERLREQVILRSPNPVLTLIEETKRASQARRLMTQFLFSKLDRTREVHCQIDHELSCPCSSGKPIALLLQSLRTLPATAAGAIPVTNTLSTWRATESFPRRTTFALLMELYRRDVLEHASIARVVRSFLESALHEWWTRGPLAAEQSFRCGELLQAVFANHHHHHHFHGGGVVVAGGSTNDTSVMDETILELMTSLLRQERIHLLAQHTAGVFAQSSTTTTLTTVLYDGIQESIWAPNRLSWFPGPLRSRIQRLCFMELVLPLHQPLCTDLQDAFKENPPNLDVVSRVVSLFDLRGYGNLNALLPALRLVVRSSLLLTYQSFQDLHETKRRPMVLADALLQWYAVQQHAISTCSAALALLNPSSALRSDLTPGSSCDPPPTTPLGNPAVNLEDMWMQLIREEGRVIFDQQHRRLLDALDAILASSNGGGGGNRGVALSGAALTAAAAADSPSSSFFPPRKAEEAALQLARLVLDWCETDRFVQWFGRSLSTRLLSVHRRLDDEAALVTFVAQRLPTEFADDVRHAKRLIDDVVQSDTTRAKILLEEDGDVRRTLRESFPQFELSLMVLNAKVWEVHEGAVIRQLLSRCRAFPVEVKVAEKLVLAEFQRRQTAVKMEGKMSIVWTHDLSSVVLKLKYTAPRLIEVSMPLFMAAVLYCFDLMSSDSVSIADCSHTLFVPPKKDDAAVNAQQQEEQAAFACEVALTRLWKLRILKKAAATTSTPMYTIDRKFQHAAKRINAGHMFTLPPMQKRTTTVDAGGTSASNGNNVPTTTAAVVADADEEQIRRRRSNVLQTTIVRNMKSLRTCPHARLLEAVVGQVVGWKVDAPSFKKEIEGLIDKEFIRRVGDMYEYVAV